MDITDPLSGKKIGLKNNGITKSEQERWESAIQNLPIVIKEVGSGKQVSGVTSLANNSSIKDLIGSDGSESFFYNTKTGAYSKNGSVTININKKTGNVKIDAPQYVLDRDYTKSVIENLKTVSSNYKSGSGSDYKYPSPEDSTKEVTADELIEMYQKGLNDNLSHFKALDEFEKETSKNVGINLNDEQAQTALSGNYDAIQSGAKSDTRVVLPTTEIANFFKGLETYQEVDGIRTAELGDLMENGYSRGKMSDEDIIALQAQVANALKNANKDTDANEYAQNYAFASFINAKNATTDFWSGAEDFRDQAGQVMSYIGQSTAELMSLASDIPVINVPFKVLNDVIGGAYKLALGKGLSDTLEYEGVEINNENIWKDFILKSAYESEETYREKAKSLGVSTVVMDIGSIGWDLFSIAAGTGAVVKGVASGTAKAAAKIEAKGTAKAVTEQAAKQTVKDVAATYANGAVADIKSDLKVFSTGEMTKRFATAATNTDNIMSGAKTMLLSAGAKNASNAFMSAAKFLTSKPVTTSINFVADTVVSATLAEPELAREVIVGSDDPKKTSEEINRQFVENGIFWAGGAMLGRAIGTLGKTTRGQAISHNVSRVMNGISTKAGDFSVNMKMRLAKVDTEDELIGRIQEKSEKKGQVAQRDKILRDLKKNLVQSGRVSWATKSEDEIMSRLKEVREYNLAIREAYNIFTKDAQGVQSYIRQWTSKDLNPEFSEAYNGMARAKGGLIKIESKKGFKPVSKGLSQEGINCVNSIGRLVNIQATERAILKDAKSSNRALTDKEYKTIAAGRTEAKWLKKNIDDYIGNDEELRAAVEEYRINANIASREMMNIVTTPMGPGGKVVLESREEVLSLRESGLYGKNGEDWMMTGRVKEEDPFLDPQTQRITVGNSKFKQREFGSTKDFEDPLDVLNRRMIAYAQEANSRAIAVVCANQKAAFKVSAADMNFYTKQNLDLDKIAEQNRKFLGQYIGNVMSGNFSAMFKDYATNQLKLANAKNSVKSRSNKLKKAKEEPVGKTTIANQKAYIANAPDDIIYESLVGKYGFNANGNLEIGEEGFDGWFNSLPKQTQEYIESEIKRVVGDYNGNYGDSVNSPNTDINVPPQQKSVNRAYDNFQEYLRISDDAESNIAHSIVANDKKLRESESISNYVDEQHKNNIVNQKEIELQQAKDKYDALLKEINETKLTKDDIYFTIDKQIDDLIDTVYGDKSLSKEGLLAVARNAGESDEIAQAYLALKMMSEAARGGKFTKELNNACLKAFNDVYKNTKNANKVASMMTKMVESRIRTKMEFYQNQLIQRGSKLVDRLSVNEEEAKLMSDIDKEFGVAKKDSSVLSQIKVRKNEIGKEVGDNNIIHVGYDSDNNPTMVMVSAATKDLLTRIPQKENTSIVNDTLYLLSKIFRANVTGVDLTSWVRQPLRDLSNILVGAGSFKTKNGFTRMEEAIGTQGLNSVQEVARWAIIDPESAENAIGGYIKAEGVSYAKKTTTGTEEAYAEAVAPGSTETEGRRLVRERTEYKTGVKGAIQLLGRKIDDLTAKEKVFGTNIPNPFHFNEWREQKMRLGVYRGGFAAARKMGYTVEQSRIYAEDLMNNSATNFSWRMYHLQNIQKTIPYLGAAVNGTKSFWHLASLDPVGVFGRLTCGICAPTAFIIGESLADEENRKIYENIPEYEKKDQLVFVVDGKKVTIPMPQEMSAFFNTPRIIIEMAYGANDGSFWQLMTNNLVSLSPIDLTGFTQNDARLAGEYGFWERVNRGVSKMAAQMLPPVIKGGIGAVTGYDMYTGKKIDTSYTYVDYETGETVYMDYKSSESGKALASLLGDWMTPAQASSLLSGLFGTSEPSIITWMGTLANKAKAGESISLSDAVTSYAESKTKEIAKVFTGEVYDKSKQAWTQAVNTLYAEKDKMLNGDVYKDLTENISKAEKAGDTEKLKKYIAERQDYVDEYRNKVKATVDNLISKYGESSFDRRKYATVISLMNLGSASGSAGTEQARALSEEEKAVNKKEAIASMYRLGFTAAKDSSILGYYATNSAGEAYFAYNHPIAILNARNIQFDAGDEHLSNITSILDDNGITRKNMFGDDYNSIKNNKTSKKNYQKEWNKKVLSTIKSYVDRYGYDAVLNSHNVQLLLFDRMFNISQYDMRDDLEKLFKETYK